jgi:hypothetical protein
MVTTDFIIQPLLIQEEESRWQGLEGAANLHYYSLHPLIYNNCPAVSIVVTTYFSEKSGSFCEYKVVLKWVKYPWNIDQKRW